MAAELTGYPSEHGLCRLLQGLVQRVALRYGELLVVEEIQCIREGDPGCVFTILEAAAA